MRVVVKPECLVIVADTDADCERLRAWSAARRDHEFRLAQGQSRAVVLMDCGCNDPVNIGSNSPHPISLIGNLAPTPFELDARKYACVEAFWQGLRFPNEEDRRRIAALDGRAAKRAGRERPYGETLFYEGQRIRVGTFGHWYLMMRACRAKFAQNEEARLALLATGERRLVHKVRTDSKTIPGALMCDIWSKIRHELRRGPPRR